jgi:UDP-2,3-diacylglucosamine pyrophosphatase LpxH
MKALPLRGTSTLHGPDGQVMLQWVKRDKGPIPIEDLAGIVKDAFADTEPVKRIPVPPQTSNQLLTVIPIGDQHHGMYAWAEESGADYDVNISEKLLVAAAAHLIDISEACDTCLIANVGDFFHYDSQRAETPQNRNALDSDTRYAKIIHTGVMMLRTFIECALVKYRNVRVINSPGNHDPVGALWLSLALSLLYEKNPRVHIDKSPGKFAYYDHGKTMICVTHGDTLKMDKLPGIMAADQPAIWGRTEHRYGITGHVHHDRVIDLPGCKIESFRTLAARDAWAAAQNYRSGRDMKSIIYHAEHGEIARHTFNVSMLS